MNLAPATIDRLIAAATAVRENAHAPYSGFQVGAAVLASDGRMFTGTNVENASCGLSVCAERHAIASAIGAGAHDLVALAVVSESSPPATPCGACRQVIMEFAPMTVICANTTGEWLAFQISQLLPEAFGPETLES